MYLLLLLLSLNIYFSFVPSPLILQIRTKYWNYHDKNRKGKYTII